MLMKSPSPVSSAARRRTAGVSSAAAAAVVALALACLAWRSSSSVGVIPFCRASPIDDNVRSGSRIRHDNSPPSGRRPNILLLLTDDQDVLLGGLSHMPILRKILIDGGTTFRNGFVHTPICCPSRSSILSGRYLHNGGAVNNSLEGNCYGKEWRGEAEKETFAVHAKKYGYRTSYAGKYLNRYPERGPDYDDDDDDDESIVPPGWEMWMGLVGNSRYYDYEVILSDDGGNTSQRIKHGSDYGRDYLPDLVANRTLEAMEQFLSSGGAADPDDDDDDSDDRPFLAVAAWPTPHGPFTPAPWAERLYDNLSAPRTGNWNASDEHLRDKHWIMRRLAPIDNSTEAFIDTTYRSRLEALRSVDDHIGQFAELLKRKGVDDNTIIMYTSDNGFQLGQHRLRVDKRHLYEYDIRVPFLAAGPSVPRGAIVDDVVLNVDIAPTILELVSGSATPSPDMDGISFAPYLLGEDAERWTKREDFLVSYHGEGNPRCGMAECPPVPPSRWHGGWMPDSYNNTYKCVRTIKKKGRTTTTTSLDGDEVGGYTDGIGGAGDGHGKGEEGENTIYCRFDDDEHFGEYYDLDSDAWELTNRYGGLSDGERERYEARLAQLDKCRGDGCRTLPPPPRRGGGRGNNDAFDVGTASGLRHEERVAV